MLAGCPSTNAPPVTPPHDAGPQPDGSVGLPIAEVARAWVTPDLGSCIYASPVLVTVGGERSVITITRTGRMAALDPTSGAIRWELQLPADVGAEVMLLSTPAIVGDRLVTAWQETTPSFMRIRHRVGVVDLATHALDPLFPTFDVSASVPAYVGGGEQVVFDSTWQLQRARLVHVDVPDRTLGLVYLAFGNGPSDQPFHGWLFEIDLDRWQSEGGDMAIVGSLVTTAENGCGPPGNRDPMLCGGGIWNSWGMEILPRPGGTYEIIFASGNGRVDFDVGAYAHSVLRTQRGLAFDRGCDESLCAPFDERNPTLACLESCTNLFVARLEPGQPALAPEDGTCEGRTFLECYGALDADLGANSPIEVEVPGGPRVFVQLGKDGAIYLIDAEHMGTLYHRLTLRDFCGTMTDTCRAVWAGTFVNHPALTTIDGDPVVVVASLMADDTHYSGITALRIAMEGGRPRFQPMWDVPSRTDPQGIVGFREHPNVPFIVDVDGEPYVFVVEVRRENPLPPGLLWGVRVRDGYAAVQQPITGSGIRFAWPVQVDDTLVITSCGADGWTNGTVEAFTLSSRR